MSQEYQIGQECIYKSENDAWRRCKVIGFNGVDTYTITGPAGPSDFVNKQEGVQESSLLTLEEAKNELSLLEVDKFYVYKGKDGNTPRLCKIKEVTDINIYTITGPGGTNDDQNPQANVLVSDLLTYKMADKVFGDIRVDKDLSILCRILERNETNNTYTITGRGGINDFQNPQENVPTRTWVVSWTIQFASIAWQSYDQGIYQWKNGIWLIGDIAERYNDNKTCIITGPWAGSIVPTKDLIRHSSGDYYGLIVPESTLITMEEGQRKFGDFRLYFSRTERIQKLHRIIKRNWVNKDYVDMELSKRGGITFEEKPLAWTYKITGSGGVNDFENPITDVRAYKENYDDDLNNDWAIARGLWTFEQATKFSGGGNRRHLQGSLKHSDAAYEDAILTNKEYPEQPFESVQIDPIEAFPEIKNLSVPNIDSLVQDVVKEVNRARTDPVAFALDIERRVKGTYRSKEYSNGLKYLCMTIAGESTQMFSEPQQANQYKEYVDNAIAFLKKQPSIDPLTFDPKLSKASLDLAKDSNNNKHTGSDGSSFTDRIQRYGSFKGASENLGGGLTGFGIVASFIIDWLNAPDYGHRKNIFSDATHIGVSCYYHSPTSQSEGFIRCVQNFATNWQSN